MRILTVDPGASYSTKDVSDGITTALEAQGHEIIRFRLDQRIARAGSWLFHNWRKQVKAGRDLTKPTPADVQYQAGVDVLERSLRHMPDWVLIFSAMYLHPDLIIMLHRAGQRVAVLLTESPYDDDRQARILPFVQQAWTNERASVPLLRAVNPNVDYLPHAIDPARHTPDLTVPFGTPHHDVVHVGTLFQERKELLEQVDWTGIDLGLYGTFDLLGPRHPLRRFIAGSVQDNARTAQLYRAAKIGLNINRRSMGFGRDAPRIERAESLGPRVLEMAATGTFFLTDHRAEFDDLFPHGIRPPVYFSPSDLEGLIRYWVAHNAEREALAARLPDAVSDQTFAARARQIAERLEAALPQLSAVSA